MSFAVEFRQGKREAQRFEAMAYAVCGLAACVLVAFGAVAVSIWNMHERSSYFGHHNSPYETARIAPRRG